MTPRHPGYDIDGQPTKVDPRDFPDPLDVQPEYGGALYRLRQQPRRRFGWRVKRWLCSVNLWEHDWERLPNYLRRCRRCDYIGGDFQWPPTWR